MPTLNRVTSSLFVILLISPMTATAAAPTWEGSYLGVNLGGVFGDTKTSTNVGAASNTSYLGAADINAVTAAGTFEQHPSSVIVGLQAGHDWLWKQMVYGVILDYGMFSLNSNNSTTNTYSDLSGQYTVNTAVSTNWLFTLRGRLGYPIVVRWPSLVYVTGGMAMTNLKVSNTFRDNTDLEGAGGSHHSQNQLGWTAGLGMELAAFKHGSIDLQYLYVNIPSSETSTSITNEQGGFGIPEASLTSPFVTTGQLYANLVKISLNYRFDM